MSSRFKVIQAALRGKTHRLAEILLVNARDRAVGVEGAVKTLDDKARLVADRTDGHRRNVQTDRPGQRHAENLGGHQSGETLGLRLDDVRARGVAKGQRDGVLPHQDWQLRLRSGQRKPQSWVIERYVRR
jgi:hypothetical protein